MSSRKRKKTFRKKTFRKKTFRKKTFRKKKNIKRKILKGGAKSIDKDLYLALKLLDLEKVKDLIKQGANPNAIMNTPFGETTYIEWFRTIIANPFNKNWVAINEYLESKDI